MFDTPYQYSLRNHTPPKKEGEYLVSTINYTFRGKGKNSYIVTVEVYDYHVYVIKFYLRIHKSCTDRYSRITGTFDCNRIIGTLGRIIIELFDKNPYASFAFVGSPSKTESKKETKRFRLYKRVIQTFAGPVNFDIYSSRELSACIALNRHYNEQDLLGKISTMFAAIYEEFSLPNDVLADI